MSLRAWWRKFNGVEDLTGLANGLKKDWLRAAVRADEAGDASVLVEKIIAAASNEMASLRATLTPPIPDATAAAIRRLADVIGAALEPADVPVAVERPAAPALPCTCGSITFTAGGQAVVAHSDGRVSPGGAVLSCIACGRRWALAEGKLVEPHAKAMPPAWTAQDLHEAVQESQQGGPARRADLRRLQEGVRRPSSTLRPPPR